MGKESYIQRIITSVVTNNLITISPDIQSGTPVFTGTRVPVSNLIDYIRGGDTIDMFLSDFPSVSRDQVDGFLALMEQIVTMTPSPPHEKSAA